MTTALPDKVGKVLNLKQPQLITEGITSRQMAVVLKEAAKEAEALVAHNLAKSTLSGNVRAAQLSKAIAGMGPLSTELWTGVGLVTRSGMYSAAQLAADQSLDLDLLIGVPAHATLQMVDAIYYNAAQVVEDLISRHTEGFALSERIYKNGKQTVGQVGRIVDKGLATQKSAKEIAREVRQHFDPSVPGGTSYAAMRLARTEINNAHHSTTTRLGAAKPWVAGFKWNLSGSHPKPDICNDYASDDHDDMGPGVFSKDNVPPKPHPQCLCYVTHVQEEPEEFMANLVQGQYDNYLVKNGVSC